MRGREPTSLGSSRMSFHVIKFPQARAVPYWCIILLVCSLLISSSQEESCQCPSSDQDPSKMHTLNSTFNELHGYLFDSNSSATYLSAGLGSYKKHPPWKLNLSEPALLVIDDRLIELWVTSSDGTTHEASFRVEFTMSIYQPMNQNTPVGGNSSLIFAIIPVYSMYRNDASLFATQLYSSWDTSESIMSANLADNKFTIRTGECEKIQLINATSSFVCVEIAIEPGPGHSSMNNYNFSIDYDHLGHNMTVQVSVLDGDLRHLFSNINFSNISSQFGFFSFYTSMGQPFQLHTWNSKVDRLSGELEHSNKKKKETTIIILSSVLGSAAVTVATAAAVYCYINSKHRGWKKELDQLAKAMQVLPGVPTQFSFSDIRRATTNFHETTQLGRGGFGSVYRCRVPSPKKGEGMLEVAVKKFSRDDNRRYEDFLAEVSVINRLRHKNIVPLVGWSYNKGEPLLVYEYMPNGSLHQHLFRRNDGNKQQPTTPISTWDTRYNMVTDIATELHYVHHEYEPRVLHRDIKANNIMIDSGFQGRLWDFGLACVVAKGKESFYDIGAPGILGFRAPEYIHSGKATTKSDIFAFGVLILEIVTGKTAVFAQHRHLTDWVWYLHKEARLPDAIDPTLTTEFYASDAKRLLLLGLACSQPNPSDRPTMVKALQIITKSEPPPDVPLEKPRFVWPPEEEQFLSSDYSFSTEQSSLGVNQTVGVDMSEAGQASSSENGGLFFRKRRQRFAPPSHSRAFTGALVHLSHCREVTETR